MSSTLEKRTTETVDEAKQAAQRVIDQHAWSSALTVFGVGVGLGILASTVIGDAGCGRDETLARRIGKQVQDTLSRKLPETVGQYFS